MTAKKNGKKGETTVKQEEMTDIEPSSEKLMSEIPGMSKEVALSPEDVITPDDNIGDYEHRIPQIGIVHQGQIFKFPEGSKCETFDGIILLVVRANVYWEESFDASGGGVPPSCYSTNSIKPSPFAMMPQATSCGRCPMNKFGSDPKGGRGKACKNVIRAHVLLDRCLDPMRLTTPPTSIGAVNDYLSMIHNLGLPYQYVNTRFSLREVSNKDGIKYSELVLEKIGQVADDDIKTKKHLKKMLKEWESRMRGDEIDFTEFEGAE